MTGFIRDGADVTADVTERCDVCIVGPAPAAPCWWPVEQGLDVVMLEAGPAVSASDFTLHERDAYPDLYQDRGAADQRPGHHHHAGEPPGAAPPSTGRPATAPRSASQALAGGPWIEGLDARARPALRRGSTHRGGLRRGPTRTTDASWRAPAPWAGRWVRRAAMRAAPTAGSAASAAPWTASRLCTSPPRRRGRLRLRLDADCEAGRSTCPVAPGPDGHCAGQGGGLLRRGHQHARAAAAFPPRRPWSRGSAHLPPPGHRGRGRPQPILGFYGAPQSIASHQYIDRDSTMSASWRPRPRSPCWWPWRAARSASTSTR